MHIYLLLEWLMSLAAFPVAIVGSGDFPAAAALSPGFLDKNDLFNGV
jgi:hypothetical protein